VTRRRLLSMKVQLLTEPRCCTYSCTSPSASLALMRGSYCSRFLLEHPTRMLSSPGWILQQNGIPGACARPRNAPQQPARRQRGGSAGARGGGPGRGVLSTPGSPGPSPCPSTAPPCRSPPTRSASRPRRNTRRAPARARAAVGVGRRRRTSCQSCNARCAGRGGAWLRRSRWGRTGFECPMYVRTHLRLLYTSQILTLPARRGGTGELTTQRSARRRGRMGQGAAQDAHEAAGTGVRRGSGRRSAGRGPTVHRGRQEEVARLGEPLDRVHALGVARPGVHTLLRDV
jgi:hypothetical protein